MVNLRQFEPADDAALISWLRTPEELLLFTGPALTWPLTSEQLDGIRAKPEIAAFTAVDDNAAAVGHIELVATAPESARMARVLVDPEVRGRGLGEQVVRAIVGEARVRGIRTLSLFVFPGNARAIALYEKLGFEHAGDSAQLPGSRVMQLGL